MRATVMPKAHDVRIENVPDATIEQPTDAIIRITLACICGSDLWPYNDGPNVERQGMGHESIGVVEDVGSDVQRIRRGDVVVMPSLIPTAAASFARRTRKRSGAAMPSLRAEMRKIGLDRFVMGSDWPAIGRIAPHYSLMRRKLPVTAAEWQELCRNTAPYIRHPR
jgi:Alcohol dehydrogenase GroES-like domain